MENILNFPETSPENSKPSLRKGFSKEYAQELRDQTAREIRRVRNLPTSSKEAPDEIKGSYQLQEVYKELQTNIIFRILERSYFNNLEQSFKEKAKRRKLDLIKDVQEDFERKLNDILRDIPLSSEEQEKYLSEVAMVQMSLDDYFAVLQRLSGKFVTHVTRQGIRDHVGMVYHSKGKGEFHNNFVDILSGSRCLISFITQLETGDDKSAETLRDWVEWLWGEGKTNQEIEDYIIKICFFEDVDDEPGNKYSSHFGSGEVLSDLYGGEAGYDIFFYYPAEFIAYNYQHRTRHSNPFYNLKDRGRNDVFVWNGDNGVPIDASLVCIPGNIMVNPKTGSQYELSDSRDPITDHQGNLIRSTEQISSREYWENFFKENPRLAPNKIIFYDAGNHPTYFGARGTGGKYDNLFSQNEFHQTTELTGVEAYKDRIDKVIRQKVRGILQEQSKEQAT